MDALDAYGLVVGTVVGLLSGLLSFFYRVKNKEELTYYLRLNGELRATNDDYRKEIAELKTELAGEQAKALVLDEQNRRLPEFAQLTKLISDNHTDLLKHQDSNHKAVIQAIMKGRR